MLTSYLVKCPHFGCSWFGSLLPQNNESGIRGGYIQSSVIRLQCPQCQGEWRARVVGDDIANLPVEELAAPCEGA